MSKLRSLSRSAFPAAWAARKAKRIAAKTDRVWKSYNKFLDEHPVTITHTTPPRPLWRRAIDCVRGWLR